VPDNDDTEKDAEQIENPSRPFWSGLLSFGLVSIPVDLIPAHRGSGSSLRMLDEDGTPLARRYYCPADEREIDSEHLLMGYELAKGKVVAVTGDELSALAPKKSREIDLRRFVDRDSIDPLYFARSYFLAPGANSGKAYRLLGAIMEKSRRAGIATFVMREREYLVAIFSDEGLLRAETLRFANQVRSSKDVGLPKAPRLEAKVLQKLTRAVEGLEAKHWDSSEVVDTHAAIRELAEKKLGRKQDVLVAGQGSDTSTAQVIDLMEVLRESLAANGLAPKGRSAAQSSVTQGKPSRRSGTRGSGTRRSATRTSATRNGKASARDGSAPKPRAASQRRPTSRGSKRKATARPKSGTNAARSSKAAARKPSRP
jgi:DNA end-binding protein Ku